MPRKSRKKTFLTTQHANKHLVPITIEMDLNTETACTVISISVTISQMANQYGTCQNQTGPYVCACPSGFIGDHTIDNVNDWTPDTRIFWSHVCWGKLAGSYQCKYDGILETVDVLPTMSTGYAPIIDARSRTRNINNIKTLSELTYIDHTLQSRDFDVASTDISARATVIYLDIIFFQIDVNRPRANVAGLKYNFMNFASVRHTITQFVRQSFVPITTKFISHNVNAATSPISTGL